MTDASAEVDAAFRSLVTTVRLRAQAALLRRLNAGYGFADARAPGELFLRDPAARARLSSDPMRPRDTHASALAEVEREIEAAASELEAQTSRLRELECRLGLGPAEAALAAIAAAYELDADVRALCHALAAPRPPALYPDACQEIHPALAAASAALTALHPRAPLVRLGLVSARNAPQTAPRLYEPLAAGARFVRWMVGDDRLTTGAGDATTFEVITPDEELGVALPDEAQAALGGDWDGAWLVIGPEGSGKLAFAHGLARARGLSLVAGRLRAEEDSPREVVAELVAEASLRGTALYLAGAELLAGDDAGAAAASAELRAFSGPVVLATRRASSAAPSLGRPARTLVLPRPELATRARAWRLALDGLGWGAEGGESAEGSAEMLAARYVVGPAVVAEVAREAARAAEADGRVAAIADLEVALARRLSLNVGPLATRVTRRARLDELVVPEEVTEPLRDLIALVRERSRILERWGYARHLGLSRGVSALFSGAPGTGKTMAASVVSSELGLELFRVDLSAVVSKWVGETEKQLARIFDEADDAQALLLFDEADSLFGKRTEVRGAQDRYANLEVNYLLQRMEQFGGVSVLTTNQESGIDAALMRRLSVRIRFPEPDAEQREALWRALLPPETALGGDVDLRRLAETYEMTGGHIRNAIVRAAVAAAREGRPLVDKDLEVGAYREYVELGKVMPNPL